MIGFDWSGPDEPINVDKSMSPTPGTPGAALTMAHAPNGASGISTVAIAAAAAAAAHRSQQAGDRQFRAEVQTDVNQLRSNLNDLEVANQALAQRLQEVIHHNSTLEMKLQENEQARKDEVVILRNNIRRCEDSVAGLSQTVETLRQAHEFQLRQQQQQREREQQQHQAHHFTWPTR